MDNFSILKKDLRAFLLFTRFKIKRILSFKAGFLMQAVGMLINNTAFVLIWYLLFKRFGNINGYTIKEIFLLQGSLVASYSIFFFFLSGTVKLDEYLYEDRFLDMQLYPVSTLVVLTTKSGDASQWGDGIEGLILLGIYSFWNPFAIPWIVVAIILITVGWYGVFLTLNSVLFWRPRLRKVLQEAGYDIFLGGGFYPTDNFKGFLRYLFTFFLFIPIMGYPMEVVRGAMDWRYLLITVFVVIGINVVGLVLWKKGVKRVESGSSTGIVE